MESFAQQAAVYQISELNKAILNLRLDLKELETRYQRSSKDFYAAFSRGEVEDSEDLLFWAGLCEMLYENEAQLAALR